MSNYYIDLEDNRDGYIESDESEKSIEESLRENGIKSVRVYRTGKCINTFYETLEEFIDRNK